MEEERTISREMAEELGVLPRPTTPIGCMLPFESQYGYERRIDRQELGYRADLARIEKQNPYVYLRGERLKVIY